MRNSIHILTPFRIMGFLMLSALTFSSCGKTSTSYSTTLSPEQKEVAENSVLNDLVMVPLYFNVHEQYSVENDTMEGSKISEVSCISGKDFIDWRFPFLFGFKDSKGEWVKFDDEADYSEIATICVVVKSLWYNETWISEAFNIYEKKQDDLNDFLINHGIDVNDKIKVGHDDSLNGIYDVPKDLAFNPEKVTKLNMDADKKFYELQNAVFLYFSENKHRITNKKLLKEINEYYYYNRPDEWDWELQHHSSGYKDYYNRYGYDPDLPLYSGKEYIRFEKLSTARTEDRTCTYDGNEVPESILLIGYH